MFNNLKKITQILPVALLILNFKRLHLHFILFVVLTLIVTGSLGKKYGLLYLFLDPEYLGKVNFLSFMILGIGFGIFFIAYNITCYILFSDNYPFIGALKRAFIKFCLNNAIIPITFLIWFLVVVVRFQSISEFRSALDIIGQISGFLVGFIGFSAIALAYFLSTNIDIFKYLGIEGIKRLVSRQRTHRIRLNQNMKWNEAGESAEWSVKHYLDTLISVLPVNKTFYTDINLLRKVLNQNQLNAVLAQIAALILLIVLGLFRANPYFQIPAGASIFLLFSILVMISGAFSYWLRGWQVPVIVSILIMVNYLQSHRLVSNISAARGLDYTYNVSYSNKFLRSITTADTIAKDKAEAIIMLENWKLKFVDTTQKPKLILINASGGGLRAGVFSFRILQKIDSLLEGQLMANTVLMSGASGGSLGLSYYRALYASGIKDISNPRYINNIASDALNEIALSVAVNDVFIPFKQVSSDNTMPSKDRGWALENAINKNTFGLLDVPINFFGAAERAAKVPMIVYTPTIAADGRRLYISPQRLSYLCADVNTSDNIPPQLDGVDFGRLMASNNANNLSTLSAIRMSATFPYISPLTSLPTIPQVQLVDAGARDNLGAETTLRFMYNFREWIAANTSGVIILNIRDTPLEIPIEAKLHRGVLNSISEPIGGFFGNWERYMQYEQENAYEVLRNTLGFPINRIVFEYSPENAADEASISWHLTTREKRNIIKAANGTLNSERMKLLKQLTVSSKP